MNDKLAMFSNPDAKFIEYVDKMHNQILKEVPIEQGSINFGDSSKIDLKVRVTNIRWLNERDTNSLYQELVTMINFYIEKANMDFFGFDLSGACRYIQHTEYNEGSFYDWHQDSFLGNHKNRTIGVFERKLSFTLQLSDSDEYTGGDLEFAELNGGDQEEFKKDMRKKGTVIVFPSFLQHRVTEVTEGQRHALVGWREGKQWT